MLLLMCAGGLLLLLFIWRWLQTEYITEKMELQKDLFEQFMSARTRMTDTLISKNLIEPILRNPNGFEITGIDDKLHDGDSIHIITEDIRGTAMRSKDWNKNDLPGNAQIEMKVVNDSVDVLYQGVKLFISKVGPDGEHDFFEKYISAGDTIMLQNYYSENLKTYGLNVKPVWVKNKLVPDFPPPLFYYESHLFDYPYGVEIENFNAFIYKKISRQIVFAFLLLSVITTAFIFSYRSLRSQIRLAAIKDDLISNISHELKTPVATVKVAIEAMQQMDPVEKKEKMRDYLVMASQEINRLDMLVNKVMNSILLDNGKQIFQKESVNLNMLVEDTIQSISAQVQQKNAHINFNADNTLNIIQGDSFHIKGILYNLIDNSLKYGTESPQITISINRSGHMITLSCSDNGPGIPEQYISRLFEKFFRVPSGNEHSIKGYGLGLYYAAQVMRESGGTIEVKNNSHAGCTFTLKFPASNE
jgi:signal transduction histidine kinase